jgi:L-fucose mutarotase
VFKVLYNKINRLAKGERMLTYRLLHPQILAALGGAGHGSQVLIADGNYPLSTGTYAQAERAYLNLAPGLVTATDVLGVLAGAIPIEAAHVMVPDNGDEPSIFGEFRQLLPGVALQPLERFAFYTAARSPNLALAIATGEQRVYANILLTIGVVL